MRYLTLPEYDAVLLASLRNLGLSDTDARTLMSARWPMDPIGLIAEAGARGLIVSADDVADFVVETHGDLGDDVPLFSPKLAEIFFGWAVASERARLTPIGIQLQRDCTDRVLKRVCRRAAAHTN